MSNLTVYRGIKLTKNLAQKLEDAAREKGFSSPSAFIRAAIENELISRKPAFDESEERIVATIDRLAQEMRKMSTGQQASSPLSRPVLPAQARVGNVVANLEFVGLSPGLVGVSQVYLQVPQVGAGDEDLIIWIGDAASEPLRITVGS